MFRPYAVTDAGLEVRVPSPMVEAKRLALFLRLVSGQDASLEQRSDHSVMVVLPITDMTPVTFKPILNRGGVK